MIGDILRRHGGMQNEQDDYEFYFLADAAKAAEEMGVHIPVPKGFDKRYATIRVRGCKVVVRVSREGHDPAQLPGWMRAKKRAEWVRVFHGANSDSSEWDEVFRCLVRPNSNSDGWAVLTEKGWSRQPQTHVKMFLQHRGLDKKTAEALMGGAVRRPWVVVARHFEPEYPGNHQWNLDGAQFAFEPAAGGHPHWDLILDHLGSSLTPALQTPWFAKYEIKTGGDYLRAWVACMCRDPYEQLPYLFSYGSENCGKSIFHEAIRLLVTKGVVSADRALKSQNDFNGELGRAVLCYIEERDVNQPSVHARIKDWVTDKTISIRQMRTDQYEIPNSTHWFRAANSPDFCPVFPGDTRITVLHVPDLPPDQEIPKSVLLDRLREEAPHFLHTVLNMELPPVTTRLRLPVVVTAAKSDLQEANASEHAIALAEWLDSAIPNPGDLWQGNSAKLRADYAAWSRSSTPDFDIVWPRHGTKVHSIIAATRPYLKSRGVEVSSNPASNQGHLVVFSRRTK